MRDQSATDSEIAALASVQYGVVARDQLALTRQAIGRRVQAGRLHPIHRGVYAVGHTVLKAEGRWMAATLATGGVLSHQTAAAAWDLLPVGATIHVTVAGDAGRKRRAGVRVHRSRTLEPRDATTLRGLPLTTRERTIADLARTTTPRRLEQLVNKSERHLDFGRLRHLAPPALQAVLSSHTTTLTRSELEERFIELCDEHGLTRPEVNTRIEGMECDFVWRAQRLVVEVDGYEFHASRTTVETDRERDVRLTTRGWRVLRFTWRHVTERPAWVASAIRLAWRAA
jgi:very-short-patch-repair endonuclease